MTTLIKILIASALMLLFGCKGEPSLQKYFVENTENKNFASIDLTPKMLNIDEAKLSISQKEAMQSFEKINVLAFKINDQNKAQFASEREKVTAILKDAKYQQLMKFGSGKEGAQISYVGSDDHIEEFVIYGNKSENGFVVARILGKDMNPTNILEMMSVLKNSNINSDQLKMIQDLIK
ncbi:DUF4252 domain-containing protein [Flavobacterium sp.]|uniref:DUF4252 domain-containing protein n=1 Tax=Flavobacterium sp. TaxID=239 RepID=UPI00286E0AC7|nr:DUF4252 domain-containing protein [Flavobacterium sp.]